MRKLHTLRIDCESSEIAIALSGKLLRLVSTESYTLKHTAGSEVLPVIWVSTYWTDTQMRAYLSVTMDAYKFNVALETLH